MVELLDEDLSAAGLASRSDSENCRIVGWRVVRWQIDGAMSRSSSGV